MSTSIPSPDAVAVTAPVARNDDDLISRIARQVLGDTQGSDRAPGSGVRDNAISEHPTAAQAISPPVHPVSPASSQTIQPVESASGGHAPSSDEAYPFGEPRCYQSKSERGGKSAPSPGWCRMRPMSFPGRTSISCAAKRRRRRPIFPIASLAGHGVALPGYNVESIRKDFPALHQKMNGRPLIWLDNAATTHKPQSVIDATSVFYSRDNSNIHRAAYELAERATRAFEGARDKVSQFIGSTDPKQLVFLRGTTEAINLVAQSYGRKNIGAGDEILLSTIEHHANIVPWQLLAEQTGAVIRVAPVNDRGELILDQFATLLSGRTKIVSITHVANSLGTVNPVEEVIALAHAYGVPVLVDAAQSAPHNAAQRHGARRRFPRAFRPQGFRADGHWGPLRQVGAPRVDAAVAGRRAHDSRRHLCEDGLPERAGEIRGGHAGHRRSGRTRCGGGLSPGRGHCRRSRPTSTTCSPTRPRRCSQCAGLRLIGTAANKASVLSFVIPGLEPEKIAAHLDENGIAARAGHHCALPALRRFGVEKTVRASLAFYNTPAEIDTLVRALRQLKRS